MTLKKSFPLSFAFPILLALVGMLFCAEASIGQTPQLRLVPEDYPTPEAALFAANPGDTILLGSDDWFTNLLIDKPITIQGRGDARLLAARGDAPIIQVKSEGVTIQELDFASGIIGVEGLAEATGLFVTRCSFNEIFGDGIRCIGCQEIAIGRCSITNCAGRGVFLDQVDGFDISQCFAAFNGGSGFELFAKNGFVSFNTLQANQFAGLSVQGSDMAFVGNEIESNFEAGAFFFNSQRISFQANSASFNTGFGVIGIGVEAALFAGNDVLRNFDIGFLFDNTRLTALETNEVSGNFGVGVYYSPSTSDNFVSGNEFSGNLFDAGVIDEGNNFIAD